MLLPRAQFTFRNVATKWHGKLLWQVDSFCLLVKAFDLLLTQRYLKVASAHAYDMFTQALTILLSLCSRPRRCPTKIHTPSVSKLLHCQITMAR
ncbi:hypothetical protein E1B28_004614 [Marasmius oreades]|uniref:Uncharacterized protein n=1 Tax=Marasmius oreades TaxID=181124 RepID=A0A9P8AD56_9AGAR|nr:uncharacterized protein E1B28_004614 [Marasmius oreades]KAG7097244.1 hypothetical protein E1B28_004614 [Marasmius oreades]